MHPRFRSKTSDIQLLLLAKYNTIVEFGIDRILEVAIEDLRKLESVSSKHNYIHVLIDSLFAG